MANQKKVYPDHAFKSLDEEDKFWMEHDPLTEGYEVSVNTPSVGQKRRSFLAVRLTGQEIDRLRQMAEKEGLNLSTFVRNMLLRGMEEKAAAARPITTEDLEKALKKVRIVKVVGARDTGARRRQGVGVS